jgi:hypothetical protein
MSGKRHGVHKTDQTAFRFPPELLARLKDEAKRHGHTMTEIVVRGTETELGRLDGITTAHEPVSPPEPPAPVAAGDEQPQPARRHAPTCKCLNGGDR